MQAPIIIAKLLANLLVAVQVHDKNKQVPVSPNVALTGNGADCRALGGISDVQNRKLLHEHTGRSLAGHLVQGRQLFLDQGLRLKGPDRPVVGNYFRCVRINHLPFPLTFRY